MPLSVEILTPNRLLLQDEVDELNLPGTEGYLGILPGHVAFLTNLGLGELMLRKDGQQRYLTVFRGYMEVSDDKVTVLAEVAEDMADIDPDRAGSPATGPWSGCAPAMPRPSTSTVPAPRCSEPSSACKSLLGEADGLEDETPDVPGAWRLTLHQNPNGYRFALDAFLLADFVPPQATGPIIDLGTGCGVVACLLARRFPAAAMGGCRA